MTSTLDSNFIDTIHLRLLESNQRFQKDYPGEPENRQPIHTVYGGAQIWRSDRAKRLSQASLKFLDNYAPDAQTFWNAIEPESTQEESYIEDLYKRVRNKLENEGVEDFRIDFEDGYGNRSNEEEDGHAQSTAKAVAQGQEDGTLPPFLGIRIKPFNEEHKNRSIRTLDLFLTSLVNETQGKVPQPFYITLPKITNVEQVRVLSDLLDELEGRLGIPSDTFSIELMIETTQSILDPKGRCPMKKMVEAAKGRCTGAHFGTYDYTANVQITAAHQDMLHPSCDFARHLMQVSLAGTGVFLSDGATNILPVPLHHNKNLTPTQERENRQAIYSAWRLHYQHIQESLRKAYYQGWDLHPGQLPTRYAAVFHFFLQGIDQAGERLRNFIEKAAQATLVGDVFDDAATGQGLLNFFLRALNSGAITEEEAIEQSGLTLEELRLRSFAKILAQRSLKS